VVATSTQLSGLSQGRVANTDGMLISAMNGA
jgi:hypothetical protein